MRLASVGLLLGACARCEPDLVEEKADLGEVSTEIQFESVERLGAHRLVASVVRADRREGVEVTRSEEAVEVIWQDWDNFDAKRIVDGDVASHTRVFQAKAFAWRGNQWTRKEDAEPSRQQLYATWSIWDESLELFLDRISLEDQGREVIEGRPARKYAVGLAEPTKTAKGKVHERAGDGQATSLTGWVWVDEATAVRLKAEVEGHWVRDTLERVLELRLVRTNIGQDQGQRHPLRRDKKRRSDGAAPPADSTTGPDGAAPTGQGEVTP